MPLPYFFYGENQDVDIHQIMLNYCFVETMQASKVFEALASDVRLDLFRLLVKNAPEGLVQGDIARLLDIPPTNLSFHLKTIVQSGLVGVEREGRFMRYKANIPLMLGIIAYLTSECCSNHPEECRKFRKASTVLPGFLPSVASSGISRNPARGCAPPKAAEQAENHVFRRSDLHA